MQTNIVMIGNFDNYDGKFVDWCNLCSSLGILKIILLDNSFGAANSLTERAKLCRSNRDVQEVVAAVGNSYERVLKKLGPDLVFIEPGFRDAQVIEEICVRHNLKVIRTTHHQTVLRPTNLLL